MIDRRMTMVLSMVLLASFAAIAEGPALDYAAVVGRVFPDCEVTFDGEKLAGTLTRSGEAVGFAVAGTKEFELEGKPHVLFVITYPEDREALFLPFLEGGAVAKPTFHEYLVLAPATDPEKATWELLDEDATSVHPRNMEIYDFIGDGTLQLNAEMTHSYFVTEPNEIIQTRRYQLYRLPGLEKIFDAITLKVVANQYTMDMVSGFQVNIRGRSRKDELRIELLDVTQKDGGVVEVPFRDGRFEYDPPPPTTRDKARTAKRGILRKKLKIQIVDPDGHPIPGALITGEISWVRSVDWAEKSEKIRAYTDETGSFEVSSPDNVDIMVMEEGYYTATRFWSREDINDGVELVRLTREHEPVTMLGQTIEFTKEEEFDRFEFGVVFRERSDFGLSNEAMTESKIESDLWITLYRTELSYLEGDASIQTHNNSVWHMRIIGLKGWRLLPEPNKYAEMREAPEDSYVEEVDHSFSEMPGKFYLQQNDGQRYGKLTLVISDDSHSGKVYRRCGIAFEVQAEPSGTRSLNRER